MAMAAQTLIQQKYVINSSIFIKKFNLPNISQLKFHSLYTQLAVMVMPLLLSVLRVYFLDAI